MPNQIKMTEKKHENNSHHDHNQKTTVDNIDTKLDEKMSKIMNKWFLEKILNHKITKNILWSKLVNDLNQKLKPNFKNIVIVLWRIAIIWWAIWLLSWLGSFGILFRFFWVWFFLYVIVSLLFSILGIITWYGMIKFKKRVTLLIVIEFWLSCVSFVFTLFSRGNLWSSIISLLISFALTILLIKNKEIFKN